MDRAPPAPTTDLRELMIEHVPYLRRYARALTQNKDDADDLVQNAMLKAIMRTASFERGTNLRAWLMTIMHNCFIDGYRKRKRSKEVGEENGRASLGLHHPANQLHTIQIRDLEIALGQLPPTQRSTVLLISLEGMSYEEIARVTCVPVGTVRSRLSRARHALVQSLEGQYRNEKNVSSLREEAMASSVSLTPILTNKTIGGRHKATLQAR